MSTRSFQGNTLEAVGTTLTALYAQGLVLPSIEGLQRELGFVVGLSLLFFVIMRKVTSVVIDRALGDYQDQKRTLVELKALMERIAHQTRRELQQIRDDIVKDFQEAKELLHGVKLDQAEMRGWRGGLDARLEQIEERCAARGVGCPIMTREKE
jgi:hypothetical protein